MAARITRVQKVDTDQHDSSMLKFQYCGDYKFADVFCPNVVCSLVSSATSDLRVSCHIHQHPCRHVHTAPPNSLTLCATQKNCVPSTLAEFRDKFIKPVSVVKRPHILLIHVEVLFCECTSCLFFFLVAAAASFFSVDWMRGSCASSSENACCYIA